MANSKQMLAVYKKRPPSLWRTSVQFCTRGATTNLLTLCVTPASCSLGFAHANRLDLDAVTGAPEVDYLLIRKW